MSKKELDDLALRELKNASVNDPYGNFDFFVKLIKAINVGNLKLLAENSNHDRFIEVYIRFEKIFSDLSRLDSETDREAYMFKLFSFNEFLAQKEFDTYGAYIEKNFTRDYKLLLKLKFNSYPHNSSLLNAFPPSKILTYAKGARADHLKILEDLTRDELMYLITRENHLTDMTNVKGLLNEMRTNEKPKTIQEVISKRDLLFSKAKVETCKCEGDSCSLDNFYKAFSRNTDYKIIENHHYKLPSYANSNDIDKLLTFLEENIEEFSKTDLLYLYLTTFQVGAFARGGNVRGVLAFINRIIKENEKEDAIVALKFVISIMNSAHLKLPSLKEWVLVYETGGFDPTFDADLAISMASGNVSGKISGRLKGLRNQAKLHSI